MNTNKRLGSNNVYFIFEIGLNGRIVKFSAEFFMSQSRMTEPKLREFSWAQS